MKTTRPFILLLLSFGLTYGCGSGEILSEDISEAAPPSAEQPQVPRPDEGLQSTPDLPENSGEEPGDQWDTILDNGGSSAASENPFFDGFTFLKDFDSFSQGVNNCGPASVRMVVNYLTGNLLDEAPLGHEMRKHDVIDTTILGSDSGTYASALTWALNTHLTSVPLRADHHKESSWAKRLKWITDSIDAGLPVVAEVQTTNRAWHWLVVIGYDLAGQRLMLANSGGHISGNMQATALGGWYEIATFDQFKIANEFGHGSLKNPLAQLLLQGATALGLSVNVLILLR